MSKFDDCDDPDNHILAFATTIVRLSWDGDGPAHSGSTTIYRHDDKYYFLCEVSGLVGPIENLEEALTRGGFHYGGTPNPELECAGEIANSEALLHAAYDLAAEPGGVVLINFETYIRRLSGELARRERDGDSLTTVYKAPSG